MTCAPLDFALDELLDDIMGTSGPNNVFAAFLPGHNLTPRSLTLNNLTPRSFTSSKLTPRSSAGPPSPAIGINKRKRAESWDSMEGFDIVQSSTDLDKPVTFDYLDQQEDKQKVVKLDKTRKKNRPTIPVTDDNDITGLESLDKHRPDKHLYKYKTWTRKPFHVVTHGFLTDEKQRLLIKMVLQNEINNEEDPKWASLVNIVRDAVSNGNPWYPTREIATKYQLYCEGKNPVNGYNHMTVFSDPRSPYIVRSRPQIFDSRVCLKTLKRQLRVNPVYIEVAQKYNMLK